MYGADVVAASLAAFSALFLAQYSFILAPCFALTSGVMAAAIFSRRASSAAACAARCSSVQRASCILAFASGSFHRPFSLSAWSALNSSDCTHFSKAPPAKLARAAADFLALTSGRSLISARAAKFLARYSGVA
ncbi:hypothetical protein D3C72_1602800 [compost metagenome]